MDEQNNSMKVGDLIRFVNTGCHGVVVQSLRMTREGRTWIYVLCGPDANGHPSREPAAFPLDYLARVAEVISENR